MKHKSFIIGILSCILIVSMLCGCSSTPKSLSGRYEKVDGGEFSYIEFFSDGKYTSSHPNYEGNYSIDGNRIRLEGVLVDSRIYYFRVNGDTLEFSYSEDFEDVDTYKK